MEITILVRVELFLVEICEWYHLLEILMVKYLSEKGTFHIYFCILLFCCLCLILVVFTIFETCFYWLVIICEAMRYIHWQFIPNRVKWMPGVYQNALPQVCKGIPKNVSLRCQMLYYC